MRTKFNWDLEPLTKPNTILEHIFSFIYKVDYQKKLQCFNENYNDILLQIEDELPKLNKFIDDLAINAIGKEKYIVKITHPRYSIFQDTAIINKSSLDIANHIISIEGGNGLHIIYNLIYQLCVIEEFRNTSDNSALKIDYNKPKTKFIQIMLDYYKSNTQDLRDEFRAFMEGITSSEAAYEQFYKDFVKAPDNPKLTKQLSSHIYKDEVPVTGAINSDEADAEDI